MAIADGIKTVAAAGTAEALSPTSILCEWVMMQAQNANTGVVHVGASTVVAATGDTARGMMVPENVSAPSANNNILYMGKCDLSNVFIDAENSGEGITFVYQTLVPPKGWG